MSQSEIAASKNLGHLSASVSRIANAKMKENFAAAGVTLSEGIVLWVLGEGREPLNQTELHSHFTLDRGAMTRTMKSLENKGFVKRQADPTDGRASVFSLTNEGNETVAAVKQGISELEAIMTYGFSQEDIETTMRVLTGALANFKNEEVCNSVLKKETTHDASH